MPANTHLNPAAKEALRDLQMPGEPDLYAELVVLFISTSDQFQKDLQARSSDFPHLRELAHAWKNNALAIGAQKLGEMCTELEAAAQILHAGKCQTIIEKMSEEYQAVKLELKAS